jgi:hypothetical protein
MLVDPFSYVWPQSFTPNVPGVPVREVLGRPRASSSLAPWVCQYPMVLVKHSETQDSNDSVVEAVEEQPVWCDCWIGCVQQKTRCVHNNHQQQQGCPKLLTNAAADLK